MSSYDVIYCEKFRKANRECSFKLETKKWIQNVSRWWLNHFNSLKTIASDHTIDWDYYLFILQYSLHFVRCCPILSTQRVGSLDTLWCPCINYSYINEYLETSLWHYPLDIQTIRGTPLISYTNHQWHTTHLIHKPSGAHHPSHTHTISGTPLISYTNRHWHTTHLIHKPPGAHHSSHTQTIRSTPLISNINHQRTPPISNTNHKGHTTHLIHKPPGAYYPSHTETIRGTPPISYTNHQGHTTHHILKPSGAHHTFQIPSIWYSATGGHHHLI